MVCRKDCTFWLKYVDEELGWYVSHVTADTNELRRGPWVSSSMRDE